MAYNPKTGFGIDEEPMTNDERVKELDAMVEEIRRQIKLMATATAYIYEAAAFLSNGGDHYRTEAQNAMGNALKALGDANPPIDWGLNEEQAWRMVNELDEPARKEVGR